MKTIRDIAPHDLAPVLALNQAALPHVSSVEMADMERFAADAARFRVIDDDGTGPEGPVGFLIALLPGLETYKSENYRWFCDSFNDFVYIDRIVIAEGMRGRGLGQAMYQDIIETARGLAPRLTCEVNSRPPNPQSMAFHQRFGFAPVGTQSTEGGTKEVTLLSLEFA